MIDTNNLDTGATWDPSAIYIKGSQWGWAEVQLKDDGTKGDDTAGDKKFTYVLSQNIDGTKPPYPGLAKTGDKPEFVFELGAAKKEYKVSSICSKIGVTAYYKRTTDTTWVAAGSIDITGGSGLGSGNTYITIP